MVFSIRQTRMMIRANLKSLHRRRAISLSMVLSVALVVCVLTGFLAMARGFEIALTSAGSPRVAVVLGSGVRQEVGSELAPAAIRTLEAMGGNIGVARDASGRLLLSREIVVPVAPSPRRGAPARTLALRGMTADGPAIRDGVTLVAGRLFAPGTRQILVGARLGRALGLGPGDTIRLGAVDWTVSGRFSARGSAFEEEIWGDLDAVRAATGREGEVQSLRLRLSDEEGLPRLQAALAGLSGPPLVAVAEADLFAAQSAATARLIRLFGWPLALLMAAGATAGALNTMMSSVSDRTREIATLRALGFGRLPTFLATWLEAVLLAAAGVAVGLGLSVALFDGWQASTIGANELRIGFTLAVTPDVMRAAGLLGLAIGMAGGALPALAALRLPLTAALRANA